VKMRGKKEVEKRITQTRTARVEKTVKKDYQEDFV